MIFREKELKDYDTKLRVTLKRNKEDLLSPWQISNFISTISSHYYKNELLNTISLALKEGIQPENIFIFNNSFNLYKSYANLDTIDLNDINGVKDFYHLGNPISLFPNEFLIKINIIFGYFRKANEILHRYNLPRMYKDILGEFINYIKHNENALERILDEIYNNAVEIIDSSKNKDFNIKQIENSLSSSRRKYLNDYDEFLREQINLEILINDIKGNIISSFKKEDKYSHLERKYFSNFFGKLNDLKRPIVAIYNKEENRIQILCNSFINSQKRDNKFLDIKEISHNSPYLICFYIGVSVVLPLIPVLKSIKLEDTIEQEEEELRREELKTDAELEEILRELEELETLPENTAVNEVETEFLHEKISLYQEINNKKFRKPIEKFEFDNRNIDIEKVE
ncbi:hypothetical protein [Bacillus mycoides]|uniref:hypothetical protein n=1 Tax=Bacillus mycoides TaxID=1405 RepID=UPI0011A91E1B|nr:hypothetical protein [Bacillus mycoides]